MKASIIVPVHNNASMVGDCIRSLTAQNFPKKDYEIVVVDNRSDDGTREEIRKHPVTYVFEGRLGRAYAYNAGIRSSKGDIVMITDSDCAADRNWVREIHGAFRSEAVSYAGGDIRAYQPTTPVEKYSDETRVMSPAFLLGKRGRMPPFFQTANVAFRRSLLDEVGLFDEALTSGQDADLGWRIWWNGCRPFFVRNAIIYHRHRRTPKGLFSQFIRYGMSQATLVGKYHKKLGTRIHINPRVIGGVFYAVLLLAPALLLGKTELDRIRPFLDLVKHSGLVAGKLIGSVKNRVIVI